MEIVMGILLIASMAWAAWESEQMIEDKKRSKRK